MKLLGTANTKTMKGEAVGFMTFIMHLAPHDAAIPGKSVCPWASKGCIAACLNTAGRGVFASIQEARARKTRFFFADRSAFMAQLVKEIAAAERKAARKGMRCAVRLNGTSDIPWEKYAVWLYPNVMRAFPNVTFYDYTKSVQRAALSVRADWPSNYQITFSRSETNELDARSLVLNGVNVAVVFAADLPATWAGKPVINGDVTDLRFMDPRGIVVGLKAKGRAKKDCSGFVVRNYSTEEIGL
jgi:hypothetical protein